MSEQTLHLESYTAEGKRLLAAAQSWADSLRHEWVSPLHVLAKLVEINAATLTAHGVDARACLLQIDHELRTLKKSTQLSALEPVTMRALGRAEAAAAREGTPVDVRHIFAGLCAESHAASKIAAAAGLTDAVLVVVPPAASISFTSETVYIFEGRRTLRALARRARGVLDVDEGSVLAERAGRLLDGIVQEAALPDRMPQLLAERESPTRLIVSRDGAAGAIVIEWRAESRSLVMSTQSESTTADEVKFSWKDASNAWLHADGGDMGHFFEALAGRLTVLYPELA